MRKSPRVLLALFAACLFPALLQAQTRLGALDLSVHITPIGSQPEPVRQFTLYILTRSYADVVKDVSAEETLPTWDEFIDKQDYSDPLKKWLKAHKEVDLSSTDLDRSLTTDDIMDIKEFFDAYEKNNSGGVTKGLPTPKYKDSDKTANPEKYEKLRQEWLTETRKFIDAHPSTVQGIELELTAINPKTPWDKLHFKHNARTAQLAPNTAQLKYLVTKVVTNLDGYASISGIPGGSYWVSTLGMEASSGDRRFTWDVPFTVQPGQTARVELSNLNATDPLHTASATP
ncbi:MAG TPA: hypothetical protein VMH20_15975 [Verrucomicrobiae bacterium]|nr:hypothetical protein [Verrucomicrobiae bacterium]